MMEPSHAHATQMQHFNLFGVYQIQPSLLGQFVFQYMAIYGYEAMSMTKNPVLSQFCVKPVHMGAQVRGIQRDAFQHGLNIGCLRGWHFWLFQAA